MWNGLFSSAVSYFTVTLITQKISLQAVGLYSAAFALSGMFVNFVLGAMGADYYPRLTGVAHDKVAMNRMVNEQTEIGLLLAVPGLLATMALAPWIIRIFYTNEFLPAVELLQWFILGCLGRVISWPQSLVMLALNKRRWLLLNESLFNIVHILLITLGLFLFGIEGVAIGFFMMYVGYTMAVYLVACHLIGFSWSAECIKIILITIPLLMVSFVASRSLPLWPATIIGAVLTAAVSIYSLRGLIQRIGPEHRISRTFAKIPGFRVLCGLQ